MSHIEIPEESAEYLTVRAVSEDVSDLSSYTVSIAVVDDEDPQDAEFKAATWSGTNNARLLIGPGTANAIAAGTYNVYVKIATGTETVVRKAGTLQIV